MIYYTVQVVIATRAVHYLLKQYWNSDIEASKTIK